MNPSTSESALNQTTTSADTSAIKLAYVTGDLFAAPSNSILIHACNTQGSWGAGIALAFKKRFPAQFKAYKAHCRSMSDDDLIGTCLLLKASDFGGAGREGQDIACIFTSRAYGRRKDAPDEIIRHTDSALRDLMRQNKGGKEMHACRFNSGKFAVPWQRTEAILKKLELSITIYTPEDEVAKY